MRKTSLSNVFQLFPVIPPERIYFCHTSCCSISSKLVFLWVSEPISVSSRVGALLSRVIYYVIWELKRNEPWIVSHDGKWCTPLCVLDMGGVLVLVALFRNTGSHWNILPFFTDFNLTGRLTSGPLKIRLQQQGSLKLEIRGKINLRLLPSL